MARSIISRAFVVPILWLWLCIGTAVADYYLLFLRLSIVQAKMRAFHDVICWRFSCFAFRMI